MKHPTPNLFIVGAAKAGTTFIFDALSLHPDIFACPIKEPRHFSAPFFERLPCNDDFRRELTPDRNAYLSLFADGRHARYRMECSVYYMMFEPIAGMLKSFCPDARIVIALRHPVDRFVSHYEQHHTQKGIDERTLEEFIEYPFSMEGLNLLDVGLYSRQIGPYLETFGADAVHLVWQDDLRANPSAVLTGLCAFLDVPPIALRDRIHRNAGGLPQSEWLHRLINRDNRFRDWIRPILPVGVKTTIRRFVNRRNLIKTKTTPEMRTRLGAYYADDVAALEEMTGRDLSAWKE